MRKNPSPDSNSLMAVPDRREPVEAFTRYRLPSGFDIVGINRAERGALNKRKRSSKNKLRVERRVGRILAG